MIEIKKASVVCTAALKSVMLYFLGCKIHRNTIDTLQAGVGLLICLFIVSCWPVMYALYRVAKADQDISSHPMCYVGLITLVRAM